MDENYKLLLENINRNGLLPSTNTTNPIMPASNNTQIIGNVSVQNNNSNIFSTSPVTPAFGNLTVQPQRRAEIRDNVELINDSTILDGFDTDILSNSNFRKIDDKTLKLKVKIARLKAELEEHKKLVESTYLKADKNQYQKMVEIQQKMEVEIQRLVAEYQNRQLKSVIFSPFAKLFQLLKHYVVLR